MSAVGVVENGPDCGGGPTPPPLRLPREETRSREELVARSPYNPAAFCPPFYHQEKKVCRPVHGCAETVQKPCRNRACTQNDPTPLENSPPGSKVGS
jgi:hypothetical protein